MDPMSHDGVMRSLRRRLWQALREEDLDRATKVYTASMRDYKEWTVQEAIEVERKRQAQEEALKKEKKEKRDARPAALKKFGSMMKNTRHSMKSLECKNGEMEGGRRRSFRKIKESSAEFNSSSSRSNNLCMDAPDFSRETSNVSSGYGGIGLLQLELNPSEPFVQDDFKSPQDSYSEQEETPPSPRKLKLRRKQTAQPRLAGFFGRLTGGDRQDMAAAAASSLEQDSMDEERNLVDTTMTTPLHEAARLGGGSLVRLMLSHGGDPNVKNGQMRTVLHMAAGGLTQEEEGLLLAAHYNNMQQSQPTRASKTFAGQEKELLGPGVGIRSNHIEPDESDDGGSSGDEEHNATSGARKAVRNMGRFFKQLGKGHDSEKEESEEDLQEKPLLRLDEQGLNLRISDRMDAVLALLSWCHADDDSPRAGEGPSINSVDARGRTALHYASELGRTEVCMAVLSSFGAILTIVDESGQTPCELAGERTHNDLASKLEARALLYADPYGMDDELMASVLAEQQFDANFSHEDEPVDDEAVSEVLKLARARRRAVRQHVIPPFSWFETWTMEEVRAERKERVRNLLERMHQILTERQLDTAMNEIMFSHADFDDSLDDVAAENIEFNIGETLQAPADMEVQVCSNDLKSSDEKSESDSGHSRNATELQDGHTAEIVAVNAVERNIEDNESDVDPELPQECGTEGILAVALDVGAAIVDIGERGLAADDNEIQSETGGDQEQLDRSLNGDVDKNSVAALSEGTPRNDTNISLESGKMQGGEDQDQNVKLEGSPHEPLSDSEGSRSGVCVWSAEVPDDVEPDERFRISLDEREIHVCCPPGLQPGQTFHFTILTDEENLSTASTDSLAVTKIKVVSEERLRQKSTMMRNEIATKLGGERNRIHESHAERLLASHGWTVLEAERAFRYDPEKALSDAGVPVALEASLTDETRPVPEDTPDVAMCLICCEEFSLASPEWRNLQGCEHGFCAECLGEYISETAQSRSSGTCIACPHHECSVPLNQTELKDLASSSDIYNALEQAADDSFVAISDRLRFCPHPGCACVVRYLIPDFVVSAGRDSFFVGLTGAVCRAVSENGKDDSNAPYTYEGIRDQRYVAMDLAQPAKAHRFCFYCGENMHWPVTCERLEKWKTKVQEEVGMPEDVEGDGNENIDDLAHRLWIKANTRPCPRCKAPIEKNDGCNHMTCSNRHCRHEFCWICRKDWKLHNTETGGFFRCNRWQAEDDHEVYDPDDPPPQQDAADALPNVRDAQAQNDLTDQSYGTAIHSARAAWKKSKVMARFLHHYRRWTAHSESSALETNMAETVSMRLAPVVEAAIEYNGFPDFNFGGKGLSFVHDAFTELLECRSVLQHSYAYAFFRYPTFYYRRQHRMMKKTEKEKGFFEQLQSQLEMLTEQLSDIVARSHLRATQTQIMFLTRGAAEKRREFTSLMIAIMDDEKREDKRREEEQNRAESPTGTSVDPSLSPPPSPTELDGPPTRVAQGIPLPLPRGEAYEEVPPHFRSIAPRDPMSMPTDANNEETTDESMIQQAEELAVREAVLASMQEFMDHSTPTHDIIDSNTVDADRWADWSCSACTYMNAGGTFCAMCGSVRG